MIITVETMRLVVLEFVMKRSLRMICSHVDSSLVFPFLKLKSMTGRIGIVSPVFRVGVGWVEFRIIWLVNLSRDIDRLFPAFPKVKK